MDSFKVNEVRRMEMGGNKAWRAFWDANAGKSWDATSVADRYNGDVGDEYKERLSAEVEGREYVPQPKKKPAPAQAQGRQAMGSSTGSPSGMGRQSPAPRGGSPAQGGQKAKNEAYFAKMGEMNNSRPEGVAPSQGGKYGGFGSSYEPDAGRAQSGGGGIPGVDDFQKDPVAALTKGFGWFTTTVGRTAKGVNDGWIQPGVQKVCPAGVGKRGRWAVGSLGQCVGG
jgi:ADP-ribosylation factor GTPase-activating protein 1